MLSKAGFKVDMVVNGQSALARLAQCDYDLVIVDMQMPKVSGLDVVRRYRSGHGAGKEIPFIILTANTTQEAKHQCEAVGVDAHLQKPVDIRYLIENILQLVERNGKEAH
jgi:CheY-like chemotaxis protein